MVICLMNLPISVCTNIYFVTIFLPRVKALPYPLSPGHVDIH